MAQKEKEEKVLRKKRQRPLSTPLGTTSTDAMDTEEAQESSKENAEKAIERDARSFCLHLGGVCFACRLVLISFAIVPGLYFSGYALISCDFGECCESVP